MTDRDQGAFEAALQSDLAAARQQNLVLADQLRAAEARNEGLAHKVDWQTKEIARITADREQFERISIRVATIAESVASVAIKQLKDLQSEIREAAFTKPSVAVPSEPATPIGADSGYIEEAMRTVDGLSLEDLGNLIGAAREPDENMEGTDFDPPIAPLSAGRTADLLPSPRIGNGDLR